MENKVSCSSGRAKLVDPNTYGSNSSDNFSVPLEDLNVSVILKSFRKGRTLLTTDDKGKTSSTDNNNSSQNIAKIDVNFIEGSEVGGKKVLTSKFTDLTTVFDKDVINDETLGITSIDIEFNSSYVPMITINFVDVRGSSIFQNEENILNDSGNKYTTFFQLPYPMFELEIKGFYGLPVKYCLHLWKFNSKFNSKTGNFEITANFIGFTFALMADMLLGYLRAIPYTEIGKQRFEQYKTETGRTILTLDNLAKKINEINTGLSREGQENPAAEQITAITDARGYLDTIKGLIVQLGKNMEKNDRSSYDFIVFKHVNDFNSEQKTNIDSSYNENVKTNITSYNEKVGEGDTFKLTESDFTNIKTETNTNGGKLYKKITKSQLNSSDTSVNAELKTKFGSKDDSQLLDTKKRLLEYLNKNFSSSPNDEELDVFDMTLLNKKLNELNNQLGDKLQNSKTTLASEFAKTVRDTLGFEPTIRHVVEMFTAAIEVFVETIFQVSLDAEGNTERRDELAQIFTSTDINISDIHKQNLDKKHFFPWPDYRKKEDAQDIYISSETGSTENVSVYVEKYLGEEGVLSSPEKVNEIVFIEDLLNAFRESYKSQQETINNANQEESTWFGSNPFDTFLFSDSEPYSRYEMLNAPDVARLMVIRFMTFLGYSYDPNLITEEDIATFAQIEVDSIMRGVKDIKIRQAITDASKDIDTFKNVKGALNTVERNVVNVNNSVVSYDYIFAPDGKPIDWKLIPINKEIVDTTNKKAVWNTNVDELIKKRDDEGFIFFTNYSAYNNANNKPFEKKDDGGTYIKIIENTTSPKSLYTPPSTLKTENVISYEKLKEKTVDTSLGLNPFGGSYGVQEFKDMDWGETTLEGLPLMYVFYKNCDVGLALNREASGEAQPKSDNKPYSTASRFFYSNGKTTKTTIPLPLTKESVYKSSTDDNISDRNIHFGLGKNRELLNDYKNGNTKITYPYVEMKFGYYDSSVLDDLRLSPVNEPNYELRQPYSQYSFSLFGSRLYYAQSERQYYKKTFPEYARAYLFLHTLPFNLDYSTSDPFSMPDIINLFKNSSGIIHAPKLWCAYIGAILWRDDTDAPVIQNGVITGGGSGSSDPIEWDPRIEEYTGWLGLTGGIPNRDEYCPTVFDIRNNGYIISYNDIKNNDMIRRMPTQVKNEFKQIFFDFVSGEGSGVKWREIADKLEIFDTGNYTSFLKYLTKCHKDNNEKVEINTIFNFSDGSYSTKKDNITKYYDIITPVKDDGDEDEDNHYLFLELRDDTSAVKTLLNALTEEVLIVNSTYKIWVENLGTESREPIAVDEALFTSYFTKVKDILTAKSDENNPTKQNEKADLAVFNTTNVNSIKLQLYKTCKNIYDKWLGGAKSINDLIFQCGGRSLVDSKLSKKYGGDETKPRMIDSFRFVARSFRDIGGLLYVNPLPINETLINNPNTSSYDVISNLLSANKFTFTPLPNFINFNDEKILASIFKPFNYNTDVIPEGACGPSFVCVYVGQPSKHLDYGTRFNEHSSKYPNDGFDLRCKDGGSSLELGPPDDFITGEGNKDYEEPVSAFVVKYSQQNQNIFKDIDLDQSEYTETDESLKIQDEISQKGSEHNRSIAGQNIYNVYAVRSYTAKVEMMGNAMIQPMMFFQLDNIPMFHGAYLITKVKHSITPQSMSTNFEGTRIRYPQTPLVTANDVYMDLLTTFVSAEGGSINTGGSGSRPASAPPILKTLIENGCSSSNINSGNIKSCKVSKVPGIEFFIDDNKRQMVCEAVKPLEEMLKDWVAWMKSEGFKPAGQNGSYAYITSMFRLDGESNSMHNFGLALDFQFFSKDFISPLTGTKQFKNEEQNVQNVKNAFDFKKNQSLKWLYNHAYEYGFVQPHWANDGNKVGNSDGEEWWHWEYHGTAAIYQLRNRPIPAVGNNSESDNPVNEIKESKIKSFVKNPKGKDGKNSVYTDMNYRQVNVSDKVTNKVGCPAPSKNKLFKSQNGYKNTIDKIINGTYTCNSNRDCQGSFDGLKQVPALWSNGKLTKRGVLAMAFGVTEGFGSAKLCKNPGNIRGSGCNGFQKYSSWKAGWEAYNSDVLSRWVNGNVPATVSATYSNCYIKETNNVLKESNVKFKEQTNYAYTKGSKPTLRQFINIYAPWGDNNNPSNYIAAVAATLKQYGYDIDVDAPMSSWL